MSFQILVILTKLFNKLKNDSLAWNQEMTKVVRRFKSLVYNFLCIGISNLQSLMMIEIDAFEICYGEIPKQKLGE